MKIDPRDRAQLEFAPVPLKRVTNLFRGFGRPIGIVTAIIIVTSVVSMAQPFLVREVVDVAIPQQDVRLLLLAVGAMLAVAATTQLLGVVQPTTDEVNGLWVDPAAQGRGVGRRCMERYCAEQGVPYTVTGLLQSYGIVIRYINRVGLGERDPFACPLVEQRRAI